MRPTEEEILIAINFFNEELNRIGEVTCREEAYDRTSSSSSGCTKQVFFVKGLNNWVLKTDWLPSIKIEEDAYARLEADYYAEAVKEGIDEFFAESYYIGTIGGYDLVLQKKVRANSAEIERIILDRAIACDDYVEQFENCEGDTDEFLNYIEDEDVVYLLCNNDNLEKYYALQYFINMHDINDLHSGNWGIDYNGKIVLIDFCGF